MPAHPTDKIRNVALVGHQGSGKTSLVEALLYRAGVRGRLGRIEDGTTVCDFDPSEHERGISMSLAVAPVPWKGVKINVIDTPGYADFAADVHAALRVADLAVFVVSAVEGVEVQTEEYWHLAETMGVPRMVFVNKLDRERADLDRVLAQLHDDFGAGFAPLELPIGLETEFHGVADVLTEKAYVYDHGHAEEAPLPEEIAEHEHDVHDEVVEGIVVADDDLLEHYLDGDVPDFATLEHALAHSVADCQAFPVLCGSALKPIAVDRLADFIVELAPSPSTRTTTIEAAASTMDIPADPDADAVVFVFKTLADQYVGRISMFSVVSGTVRRDDHLVDTRTSTDQRLHEVFALRGAEHVEQDAFAAGDIGAVAKLHDVQTGDTLAVKGVPVKVPPLERPPAQLAMAVEPATRADEDKLATALAKLAEEDPTLVVDHDPVTRQTVLRGMGDIHLQLTVDRLARKFGVDVTLLDVEVPFRATATRNASVEYTHKKQSGGHGQYARVHLELTPLPPGDGFAFDSKITGGAVSKNYIPAVRAGIEDAMASGHDGKPVTDVRVTLVDGKEHSVDSSEMAFRTAGAMAFRELLDHAGTVVLEPVAHIEVTVPPDLLGDVIADLNSRRGMILGTDVDSPSQQRVTAEVPEVELRRYAVTLRSITHGRGHFTSRHERYQHMP